MTYTQMADLIGKKGFIQMGSLTIEVTIRDLKVSYGRGRFLVVPVAGSGEQWVELVQLADGKSAQDGKLS